jgi:alanyl-tRNA synthetase
MKDIFNNFFEARNHVHIPSSPVFIAGDDSLLFTNSGMNQFKKYIRGDEEAPHKLVYNIQVP